MLLYGTGLYGVLQKPTVQYGSHGSGMTRNPIVRYCTAGPMFPTVRYGADRNAYFDRAVYKALWFI